MSGLCCVLQPCCVIQPWTNPANECSRVFCDNLFCRCMFGFLWSSQTESCAMLKHWTQCCIKLVGESKGKHRHKKDFELSAQTISTKRPLKHQWQKTWCFNLELFRKGFDPTLTWEHCTLDVVGYSTTHIQWWTYREHCTHETLQSRWTQYGRHWMDVKGYISTHDMLQSLTRCLADIGCGRI